MNEPKSELMAGLEDANKRTMNMEIAHRTDGAIKKLRRAERDVANAKAVLEWARNRQAELAAQATQTGVGLRLKEKWDAAERAEQALKEKYSWAPGDVTVRPSTQAEAEQAEAQVKASVADT